MNGKILLFQIPEGQDLGKICRIAQELGVEVRRVFPSEYGRTVGQIAYLPPMQEVSTGILSEPMMVLCMPQKRVERLVDALHQAGVAPICKAMLTSTNAAWTPHRLIAELQRERAEFAKMRK